MGLTYADVVIDLQAGDTGKGKVANWLASEPGAYDAVLRYNGGPNAGHTIFVDGKKVVTHQVPVGIFHNIPSIIGAGCVVNLSKLNNELADLRSAGFNGDVFIDKRAHIILPEHIEQDGKDTKIGTTKQGIGPAYEAKVGRRGMRAEDVHRDMGLPNGVNLLDSYYFLKNGDDIKLLCEGAQGFQLDVDWGDYPYVTSAPCTISSVIQNGVPMTRIRSVIGTMKAYETYSGFKTHYTTNDPIFDKIQELGGEFGATTGRKRQVRWLHLDEVLRAMYINSVTNVIINKVDVLDQIGTYTAVFEGTTHTFTNGNEFRAWVEQVLIENYFDPEMGYGHVVHVNNGAIITWSTSPETV